MDQWNGNHSKLSNLSRNLLRVSSHLRTFSSLFLIPQFLRRLAYHIEVLHDRQWMSKTPLNRGAASCSLITTYSLFTFPNLSSFVVLAKLSCTKKQINTNPFYFIFHHPRLKMLGIMPVQSVFCWPGCLWLLAWFGWLFWKSINSARGSV